MTVAFTLGTPLSMAPVRTGVGGTEWPHQSPRQTDWAPGQVEVQWRKEVSVGGLGLEDFLHI